MTDLAPSSDESAALPGPTLAALASIAAIGILWNALGELSYARPILLLAPIPVLVFTALRARVAGVYVLFVLIAIGWVERLGLRQPDDDRSKS